MNDVILYLTSPNDTQRLNNSLNNLRQLSKLKKDIIVLTTKKIYNDEFYKLAKVVVVDSYNSPLKKLFYKKSLCYSVPYNHPYGSFFYANLSYKILVNTHFLSLIRNTKKLISLAYAFKYEHFFYVEDDHYFSEEGLNQIEKYFKQLKDEQLNGIYFSNFYTCRNDEILMPVLHSYFWFGNCSYFNESIVHKLPETYDDIGVVYPYTCSYETILNWFLNANVFNKDKVKFINVKERSLETIFGNDCDFNQYYTYINIDDDSRITVLYDEKENSALVLFTLELLKFDKQINKIDIKSYDTLINTVYYDTLKTNSIYWVYFDFNKYKNLQIYINNKFVKEFKDLTIEKIKNNGFWN